MEITVAITSCGGQIIPGIIDCLRSEPDHDFHIVGVDMDPNAVGRKFVDEFYTVPGGLEDEYIPRVLEIVESETIDVVVPLSDQETRSLSKHKDEFRSVDTEVLTPDGDLVEIASDKGSMLEYLDNEGVSVPEFFLPNSLTDLDSVVNKLGYPENDIVIKPRRQRAARGFWKVSEKRPTQDLVMNKKGLHTLPYEVLRELLTDGESFPDLLAMEYLDGPHYSVDSFSINGKSIYQIPIRQVEPDVGQIQVGEVEYNVEIQRKVKEIADTFEFSQNVNIDLAYTNSSSRTLLPYEINPRISGLISVNSNSGINLLLYGILNALDQEIPTEQNFEEIRMHRCWQEIYEY
ncbi:ATP-grasp domain-containing protein [Halobellus captivus]|uniref:ATP-grasp domain-containing protein n=1 Tax=Halobellus captivus TaxID=2592614 RepID=UPI0011A6CD8C|nr:ATP-grasp domain-containing protein [Halobellus captivus]